ncbi:GlxA family transcriptional regulator [Kribbella lupini]|uniref:Helix-turn-helix domain-containing protein n=1 Tax=Kribbella lupini TaxID=291602 RepID=A0ABP4MY83_9ACTN
MLSVAILVVPRVIDLDVTIPAYILGKQGGYDVLLCGDADVPGSALRPAAPLAAAAAADIVVVPGYDDPEVPLPAEYLELLRTTAERGARLVGICTGTFALAASGVLDRRDATTHWQYVESLRALYPMVNVLGDQLFVEDGRLLTSAGGGAAIDACLHLVRSDFGAEAAHAAGQGVVAAPVRSGDQRQQLGVPAPPRSDLSPTRGWVLENLGEPITVQQLADRSHLPRRTFIRHFEAETGQSPMRWVTTQRLLSARRLLEATDWPVERIAGATGFGSAANFRAVFRREVGTTPSAYRREAAVGRGARDAGDQVPGRQAATAGQRTSTTLAGMPSAGSPR